LWSVDVGTARVLKIATLSRLSIGEVLADKLNQARSVRDGIVVSAQDTLTLDEGFYRVDVASGGATRLASGKYHVASLGASRDGSRLVFVRESADAPADLRSASLDHVQDAAKITSFNPELTAARFGNTRLLSYRDASGRELHAALLEPPGWSPGHRVPTILYPYATANKSRWINRFGFNPGGYNWFDNMQIYATRGYAVVFPDAPVRAGRPLADISGMILPAADAAVKSGVADRERLGVMGVSYGGYTVYSLLVQSNRFHAAIASAGFSDWIATTFELSADGAAYGLHVAEERFGGIGATPWDRPDRYIVNSPFWYLDRVRTPILIVHGTSDTAVNVFNSQMTFAALRRLGKDVEFVSYAGEPHGPSAGWRYANQLDYIERALGWFDRYLKVGGRTNVGKL